MYILHIINFETRMGQRLINSTSFSERKKEDQRYCKI